MRYILLDRITAVEPGRSARGLKAVTLTDEVLHDHFPDYPIYPGALLVEAAAQLAGFLVEVTENRPSEEPRRALLAQIDRAKFYRPAQPGDSVELFAELAQSLDAAAKVSVGADVRGEKCMRATLTFMLRAVDSERVHAQRRYLYALWTRELPDKVWLP
ncbi:3-hydroxyacyl-ACP dehydratase FabZ family protein [Sorangium sp. So ce406]|uniref:3-hydroxyacyl-ACP dehydratase FabZ family protein n=1 Tax=Sorangium sp. So ce406 TaxID=3133311 RepID=UPI003F5C5757